MRIVILRYGTAVLKRGMRPSADRLLYHRSLSSKTIVSVTIRRIRESKWMLFESNIVRTTISQSMNPPLATCAHTQNE